MELDHDGDPIAMIAVTGQEVARVVLQHGPDDVYVSKVRCLRSRLPVCHTACMRIGSP